MFGNANATTGVYDVKYVLRKYVNVYVAGRQGTLWRLPLAGLAPVECASQEFFEPFVVRGVKLCHLRSQVRWERCRVVRVELPAGVGFKRRPGHEEQHGTLDGKAAAASAVGKPSHAAHAVVWRARSLTRGHCVQPFGSAGVTRSGNEQRRPRGHPPLFRNQLLHHARRDVLWQVMLGESNKGKSLEKNPEHMQR